MLRLHNDFVVHRFLRIADFVRNLLRRGEQDTSAKLGDVTLVHTLDRMSDQQIHDGGIDAELGVMAAGGVLSRVWSVVLPVLGL